MNHPLCPVRRTDEEKCCRTVNQPSRLQHTVLTPNFNIEFSSLARQIFVHCTCSVEASLPYSSEDMQQKLDINGRVVDVQCGEGAVHRCWPTTRGLTRSSSHLPHHPSRYLIHTKWNCYVRTTTLPQQVNWSATGYDIAVIVYWRRTLVMAAQRLMRFKCLSGWLGSEEGGIDIGIGSNSWDEIKTSFVCCI